MVDVVFNGLLNPTCGLKQIDAVYVKSWLVHRFSQINDQFKNAYCNDLAIKGT